MKSFAMKPLAREQIGHHSVNKPSIVKPFLPFLSVLMLLSGCSTTSEVFECEAGKGIGCKSISEVNKMVDTGKLAHNEEPNSLKAVAPVFAHNNMNTESNPVKAHEIVLSDLTTVSRVQETPLRIWIAPFQDEQGNLHEGSVVHTVIRPGYWQLTPNGEGVKHAE
ncbi:MAG: type IV conjugative transfer system lipoprotein TraV [Alphaproteobacteria bacterium]|nr:type IV conjugative transfer system lipoprotein TraV [Alphaproteobacteria bacterium]